MKFAVSRRGVLSAVSARWLSFATCTSTTDLHLLVLGRAFEDISATFDELIAGTIDLGDGLMEQFDGIERQILATPATTIEGLRVKARVACWALLGDLDAVDQSTTDKRMMASILCDLIRLHDPDMERPGAIAALVEEAIL
jgi:hypothetical protein